MAQSQHPTLAEHISLPQRAHHVNQRRSIVDKDARAFPIEVATQPTALDDTGKLPSPTAILNIVSDPVESPIARTAAISGRCYRSGQRRTESGSCPYA
jgi:hypothetical protein